jgi:hypothetical protein
MEMAITETSIGDWNAVQETLVYHRLGEKIRTREVIYYYEL